MTGDRENFLFRGRRNVTTGNGLPAWTARLLTPPLPRPPLGSRKRKRHLKKFIKSDKARASLTHEL